MKFLNNNEQGYTLLIALLVVVLFTIMGVSIMTLNMNSTAKNDSRESNTQAQDLAVKGLDYVVKEIEAKVATLAESRNGLTPEEFDIEFKMILDSYKCEAATANTNLENVITGSAQYCIVDHRDSPNVDTPHMREVDFRSVGKVENKEFVTGASYLLGTTADSDFEYALVTYGNNDLNINKTPSTGNIELHGGLQITGNIYADNALITSNSSRFKNTIVPSVFPSIVGNTNNTGQPTSASVEQKVGGDLQKLAVANTGQKLTDDLERIGDPDYVIGYNSFNNDSAYNSSQTDGNVKIDFKIDQLIDNKRAEFFKSPTSLEFKSDISPVQTGYAGKDHLWLSTYTNYALMSESELKSGVMRYYGANVRNLQSDATKVYPRAYRVVHENIDWFNTEITDPNLFNWTLYGPNNLKNVAFPMELRLKYGAKSGLDHFSTNPVLNVETAYIEKDMIVGLGTTNENNLGLFDNILSLDALGLLGLLDKTVNFDTPVELNGTFYVNGNLTISSARLTGNATFIVRGKTDIKFSDIGIDPSDYSKDYNINIISKGPVTMSYIGNNHNNNEKLKSIGEFVNDIHASKWKGHIHSDDKILIDGASSNLKIDGSISSKQIEITSIKGRAIPSCRTLGYYLDEHLVDGLVANLLGGLITKSAAEKLLNSLVGDENPNAAYNLVLDQQGNKFTTNCFEKVAGQTAAEIKVPKFLIEALDLNVLPVGYDKVPVESRVIINYDPLPIASLKQKFNMIVYEGNPKITKLNPPQETSRE